MNSINNEIINEGITYDTSATNYIYECKNSLNVLNSLTNGIKKKNFINFISFLETINSDYQNGSIININVNAIFFVIFEKVL